MAPYLKWRSCLWKWFLQVLSPHCWILKLMSYPLGPGSLWNPWHLGLSSGSLPYPYLVPSLIVTYLCSFSWLSRLLFYLFLYLALLPFSPPSPHSHLGPSFPLPPIIILFPFVSEIEAFTLWASILLSLIKSASCIVNSLTF